MPSSNPVLSENTFSHFQQQQATSGSFMTIDGAVNKTALLLLLIVASAAWSWSLYLSQNAFYMPVLLGGTILGLVLALVTIFKKEWSPVTAPLYAVFEGAALGALSGFFNEAYPGIVIEAVLLTFGTLGVLLLAYKSKLIQVTDNFRLGVVAATGEAGFVRLVVGSGPVPEAACQTPSSGVVPAWYAPGFDGRPVDRETRQRETLCGLAAHASGEVARITGNVHHFGVRQNFNVEIAPGLDEFRGDGAHRAVVGGEGLVQLRHVPADGGFGFDEIDFEALLGEVEAGLHPGDAAAHDHDGSDRAMAIARSGEV